MYDNLKTVMAAKGTTIDAMAKLLKVQQSTIQNKIDGGDEFTFDQAQTISEVMFPEYSMKYLFHRAETETLKGRVISMYNTVGAFASAMGWSFGKTSEIVNKKQEPTAADIEAMAEKLKVKSPTEFKKLFLN